MVISAFLCISHVCTFISKLLIEVQIKVIYKIKFYLRIRDQYKKHFYNPSNALNVKNSLNNTRDVGCDNSLLENEKGLLIC